MPTASCFPTVQSQSKIVFGQFNAVTAIQERGRLNAEVMAAVLKYAEGPVVIESVQIENLDFSNEYEKSIEQRMLAEVEVQRLRQNAEREKVQAEIVVTKATAEANAVRQRAQAESEAIRLRGEAEAPRSAPRGAALGDNPNLDRPGSGREMGWQASGDDAARRRGADAQSRPAPCPRTSSACGSAGSHDRSGALGRRDRERS